MSVYRERPTHDRVPVEVHKDPRWPWVAGAMTFVSFVFILVVAGVR